MVIYSLIYLASMNNSSHTLVEQAYEIETLSQQKCDKKLKKDCVLELLILFKSYCFHLRIITVLMALSLYDSIYAYIKQHLDRAKPFQFLSVSYRHGYGEVFAYIGGVHLSFGSGHG